MCLVWSHFLCSWPWIRYFIKCCRPSFSFPNRLWCIACGPCRVANWFFIDVPGNETLVLSTVAQVNFATCAVPGATTRASFNSAPVLGVLHLLGEVKSAVDPFEFGWIFFGRPMVKKKTFVRTNGQAPDITSEKNKHLYAHTVDIKLELFIDITLQRENQ